MRKPDRTIRSFISRGLSRRRFFRTGGAGVASAVIAGVGVRSAVAAPAQVNAVQAGLRAADLRAIDPHVMTARSVPLWQIGIPRDPHSAHRPRQAAGRRPFRSAHRGARPGRSERGDYTPGDQWARRTRATAGWRTHPYKRHLEQSRSHVSQPALRAPRSLHTHGDSGGRRAGAVDALGGGTRGRAFAAQRQESEERDLLSRRRHGPGSHHRGADPVSRHLGRQVPWPARDGPVRVPRDRDDVRCGLDRDRFG